MTLIEQMNTDRNSTQMTRIELINTDFFLSAKISKISVLRSNQRSIQNSISVQLK